MFSQCSGARANDTARSCSNTSRGRRSTHERAANSGARCRADLATRRGSGADSRPSANGRLARVPSG